MIPNSSQRLCFFRGYQLHHVDWNQTPFHDSCSLECRVNAFWFEKFVCSSYLITKTFRWNFLETFVFVSFSERRRNIYVSQPQLGGILFTQCHCFLTVWCYICNSKGCHCFFDEGCVVCNSKGCHCFLDEGCVLCNSKRVSDPYHKYMIWLQHLKALV